MKLLFCPSCNSIFNISLDIKYCECKKSSAKYIDEINAEYYGIAIPIGIANSSFIKALQLSKIENKYQHSPTECKGVNFNSFVILNCSISIIKK